MTTPLLLLMIIVMWAAVLLPPYLRDRKEGLPSSGNGSGIGQRLSELTQSLSAKGSSYLPVNSGSLGGRQQPGAPLPAGSRQPLARTGQSAVPQSSALQVLGPDGRPDRAAEPQPSTGEAARLLAPESDPKPAPAPATEAVAGAAFARKRRRDVLYTLLAAAGLSLVMAWALGGPVVLLHLMLDVALIGFVALLIRREKTQAEREMKVAFLPHGEGASATELLAQGGGFHPQMVEQPVVEPTGFRVVRSQAN